MKKLLIVVAIGIVTLFAGLAALVLLINPNQFKPLIVEQTKLATGLDLVIEGDIRWQFFPSLGFAVGKTEMRNPQGFAEPNLFQVNTVDVSIEIMPLLSQQLKVGNINLAGANIQLETLKDGRTNLDSLTASDSAAEEQSPTSTTTSVSVSSGSASAEDSQTQQNWTINIAGVSVSDSNLEILDRQTASSTSLQVNKLSVSEFSPGAWSQLAFDLQGNSNAQNFAAQGSAEFNVAKDLQSGSLRKVELDASFKDATNTIDSAKLTIDQFELGKAAAVSFSVDGVVAEMNLALSGKTQFTLDSAFKSLTAKALEINADVKGDALPSSPMKVVLASDIEFDLEKNLLSTKLNKLAANEMVFDGNATVALADIPQIRFNLHSADVDLDRFLGLNQTSGSESVASGESSSSNPLATPVAAEAEPDLSALKTLDLAGTLTLDKFKASNSEMNNVAAKIAVNRGVAQLESFSANLYQGSIAASAKLDARKSPATYSVKNNVKGVQIEPLLVAVADMDKVEGTGNIVASLTGKSLMPTALMKNLAGTVEINFADGAVKGANIAQMIRTGYAKIKGQTISDEDQQQKQTDFSALTATLALKNGEVSTQNLAMQSPLLRIHGKGKADYIAQTVNFWLDTSVVGSLEGQGGKDVDDLKDLTIPVEIKGPWAEPNIDIALDVVLKQRAQKQIDKEVSKLQDKLESKLNDDKTKEAVNKLFKKLF